MKIYFNEKNIPKNQRFWILRILNLNKKLPASIKNGHENTSVKGLLMQDPFTNYQSPNQGAFHINPSPDIIFNFAIVSILITIGSWGFEDTISQKSKES